MLYSNVSTYPQKVFFSKSPKDELKQRADALIDDDEEESSGTLELAPEPKRRPKRSRRETEVPKNEFPPPPGDAIEPLPTETTEPAVPTEEPPGTATALPEIAVGSDGET